MTDRRRSRKPPGKGGTLRVLPLGGLGEIGKNMSIVEYDGRIVVIDCGVRFPTAEMHGIDLVLPDFTYLKDRRDKVEAIVITHGHEDHLGALPWVLRELGDAVPVVYGRHLTVAMANSKLEEHKLHTKASQLDREGEKKLAALREKSPEDYERFLRAFAHLVTGLGGETDADTNERTTRAGLPTDAELVGGLCAVMRHDAFAHRDLQAVDGRTRFGGVFHFDKAETLAPAGVAIHDHLRAAHVAKRGKQGF